MAKQAQRGICAKSAIIIWLYHFSFKKSNNHLMDVGLFNVLFITRNGLLE